ncbi:MAG: molybdenum cofactor guanylyltransferase [Clostridiaceae bacterium]|nr:molybdenum cofactor guanylyltransferase [Clostridiaceae bacterium]MBW4860988.1 molybdenum cofactor guanylyltransferase [Clostridiaceae bacterium]MBW4867613.1 molybdenum cofactor guanylyltransferase [Clostridiaceae bacterium]
MRKFGTAAILAGGKSTRMGFDKQLLKINEKRLIDNLVSKLSVEFEEIIVVTNNPQYYLDFNFKVVKDIIVGKGPLSGIHAGLKESNSQFVYFIACDMPNINLKYIRYMKYKIRDLDMDIKACVTKFGVNIEPFNGFYSKDIILNIEDYLVQGKRSLNRLIKQLQTYYVEEEEARMFSPNWDMFLNLNTKEDLEYFLKDNCNIS